MISCLHRFFRNWLSAIVILVLGLFILPEPVTPSSSRLELIHADISRGIVENDIPLRMLEGNVHARQDSIELFCERAIYNELEKVLHLIGDVRMYRGKDTLLAKEARYFEDSKIAIAEGRVKIFRPSQHMRSDYMEYHYQTDEIRATGNLYMSDQENAVAVTAGEGEYLPEQEYSYVERDAHLWRIDSTSTDTVHIYSRKMEYIFSEERKAIARDSVKIQQGNLIAYCDSAIYLINDDVIFLKSEPRAMQENNKMNGKEMKMILENREIKEIHIQGEAEAISILDSSTQKENKLEGREIVMYIQNRKLNQIQAISNARSYYHLKENEDDRGINVASADTIKAFIVENELDSIAVIGGAQGTYYPENYKGKIVRE
jgi:lipopolysaccharide export system protein LptA